MSDCYSKMEVKLFGDEFPKKGEFCKKCKTYIPKFCDLTAEQENHLKELISKDEKILAVKQLVEYTGCSHRWAKIWVLHPNGPTPVLSGPPCPHCGKPLRTSKAKQCPHCLKRWN